MTQAADPRARIEDRSRNKFTAKRNELAQATLSTLSELGYARTSLREIAQNSEYSHGVLHYYFTDKIDLITHAVRLYEETCVTRYDDVVETARDADEVRIAFSDKFFTTLVADAPLHRLWYDVRNQSLFEDAFRANVLEIEARREAMTWRVITQYCSFVATTPPFDMATTYALLDGIFQRALLHHFAGNDDQVDAARAQLEAVFRLLEAGTP